MKIYLRALLLMCIMLFVLPALAADDAADNACYDGGSMAGKCNLSTEAETEWAWTCGWYIARAQSGALPASGVPSWCGYRPVTSPTTGVPGCYDSSMVGFADLRITGAFMTLNNAVFYSASEDGSCQGATSPAIVVQALNSTDANDRCQSFLIGLNSSTLLTSWGYNAPANLYLCQSAPI